jgi:hypothetical protein
LRGFGRGIPLELHGRLDKEELGGNVSLAEFVTLCKAERYISEASEHPLKFAQNRTMDNFKRGACSPLDKNDVSSLYL